MPALANPDAEQAREKNTVDVIEEVRKLLEAHAHDEILESYDAVMRSMGEPQGPQYVGAPNYSVQFQAS
jgi:hypothetical protein